MMKNNLKSIISDLSKKQFTNTFNPYKDICDLYDVHTANKIRLENLKLYLEYFSTLDSIDLWIGRDLGYKGGRRTGIPFTSENNINSLNSKLNLNLQIVSKEKNLSSEVSANTIWTMYEKLPKNIFFWNIFPFHPYEKDNQQSNRKYNRLEEEFGIYILTKLINSLNISRIICIGNDSFESIKKLDIPDHMIQHHVRHPSYGGVNIFKNKISEIYNLTDKAQYDLFDL
ncbi:hypothetical protein GFH30_03450 [Acinetobacter wanghuae]|uniref:Uracil-DNA glycosylase n=1 Tax=Acinetobacter wanghuae TaxID=2662362 RepID=A0A5Q0P3B4_9GAMM|nr:uracil-DNA glycosylase [Acinetobacter wanghuae]MQW92270.1 hypothetical protein [Acinetobacter wanghuae]QGA10511.1 hypothetical protein GFH30_03450 [Acinetobacter wanghuae]